MNTIGRYEICGRLGRGGMSTVYKAKAPITGRIVALKVLKPRDEIFEDLVGWQKLCELFIEEAKIMGSVTHDHIAKIIDADHDGDTPFIVLEYFSHSIGDFIGEAYRVEDDTRIISIPRSFMYMIQALKGLERLHFAGIVHRDIKPYNLMITNDDRVKIIDLGLSRVRGEESLAVPGMQVGSPYYAAPEQMRSPEGADSRADLFSLGVLLYRMLTGKLVEMKRGGFDPPSAFNQNLDSRWDDFLFRALQPRPEQRFSTALEMRLALESLNDEWRMSSAAQCLLEDEPVANGERPAGPAPLRSEPARVMYKEIRQKLGLDELFRPRFYQHHRLQPISRLLLYDPQTDLHWQRQGSGYTLDWKQAHRYIDHLNRDGFAGKDDWRLPTIDELLTILRQPTVERDICLDPSFAPIIHWLWSADHCTRKQAWMADIVETYFGRQDLDGSASVCAVSSGSHI
jgi:serine/threonine protein kinase